MALNKTGDYTLSLLDDDFIFNLQTQAQREVFARIASLTINEDPVEYIEGKIIGGNINIDGSSAVRRTCSLSMVCEKLEINDFYWGIKTKVKIEIGIKNTLVDKEKKVLYRYKRDDYGNLLYYFTKDNEVAEYVSVYQKKENADEFEEFLDKFEIKEYVNKYGSVITGDNIQDLYHPMPKLEAVEGYNDYKDFPEIIWFPQGTFVLNAFNTAISTNGYTVSLSGKDKMCLLNGELSGSLFASVDFGTEEYVRDVYFEVDIDPLDFITRKYYIQTGKDKFELLNSEWIEDPETNERPKLYTKSYEYLKKKIPLDKIIREAVHAYAKEPYHNIIINDLENYGLEQLTYKGDKTLYALKNKSTGHFSQLAIAGTVPEIDEAVADPSFQQDYLVDSLASDSETPTTITLGALNTEYTIAILNYGDDIGYRLTELVYAGDLISSIGESLTSILDKIKNMLGDFEYFYDLDGRFIFQRKKIYVNTVWSQLSKNTADNEQFVDYSENNTSIVFNFEGNKLISAVQNSPLLTNLKNDYSVWGQRTTLSGATVPIHARYAIDKKPTYYKNLKGKVFITSDYEPLESEQEQEDQETQNFYKVPVPPCLWKQGGEPGESDWWNLVNWAELYYLKTGAYPSTKLMNYGTIVTDEETGETIEKGFKGRIEFPNGEYFDNSNLSASANGQLIIDLDTDGNPIKSIIQREGGKPVSWSYRQHGFNGCNHTYAEFLKYNVLNPSMRSYIYKPSIPDQSIIDEDKEHEQEDPHPVTPSNFNIVDWREIIYQMALDYFAGQGCSEDSPIKDDEDNIVLSSPDHFLSVVAANNPERYPSGYTGYEQYYTDLQGFWRQLYDPDAKIKKIYTPGHYETIQTFNEQIDTYETSIVWQDETLSDLTSDFYVYDSENDRQELEDEINNTAILTSAEKTNLLNKLNEYEKEDLKYWNVSIFNSPQDLNFWFEFLDSSYELAQFAIPIVGVRSKVVNDTKVESIFYKDIPDVILHSVNAGTESDWIPVSRRDILDNSGFSFLYLPKGMEQLFSISYRGKSAKDKIDELLYNFSYCIENITITALPIYNLQPNTRIYVRDEATHINGEYIMSKITIPLEHSGTMSITATKAPERLY